VRFVLELPERFGRLRCLAERADGGGCSSESLTAEAMPSKQMNAKRKAVFERIESFEQAIGRAREYLESGKHADWSGFRPFFARKFEDGRELPPHKDWVKNVFLPHMERH
jgi:hypothetical protein